jgi:hypothetical protein
MRYVPSVVFFILAILAAILLRSEYEPWVENQTCCNIGKLSNGTCVDDPVYTTGWITGNRATVLLGAMLLVFISLTMPSDNLSTRATQNKIGAMIGVFIGVFIGTNVVVWRLFALDCDNPPVSPTVALFSTPNPDSVEMTLVMLCGFGWIVISIPMAIRGLYRPDPVETVDPLKQELLGLSEPGLPDSSV